MKYLDKKAVVEYKTIFFAEINSNDGIMLNIIHIGNIGLKTVKCLWHLKCVLKYMCPINLCKDYVDTSIMLKMMIIMYRNNRHEY